MTRNLSLIVLSKLVLYIHISSFRVRFYEKKSKMTFRQSFLLCYLFFECSRLARAGVQRVSSQDAMLCDYGLFNHTFAQNVLQSILHRDKLCWDSSHVAALSAASHLPVASTEHAAKRAVSIQCE